MIRQFSIFRRVFTWPRLWNYRQSIQESRRSVFPAAAAGQAQQAQQAQLVSQAVSLAQEKERNRISGELHDNINQLLLTAKLHIAVARKREGAGDDLLQKAEDYLATAVEEIRELTKQLATTRVLHTGLEKSIAAIGAAMLVLKDIRLQATISAALVEKLSADQQIMVFRIFQEQSSNILKYAEASMASIGLKEGRKGAELVIRDNGKGFDKGLIRLNGLGFSNIFNRVQAQKGEMDIITSPGKGCILTVHFPLTD